MDSPIRCKKCKKIALYIPKEYTLNVPIVCVSCHTGKKPKNTKKTATGNYVKVKKGVRKDIHPTYFFRSPTEANFARILQYEGVEFTFEERSFSFAGYKRKPFMWIMDFQIIKGNSKFPNCFVEVKGYMNSQSRQKLRRLKKCYSEEAANTLIVIYSKYNKKDIALCESLGYKYMFYDVLTKEYKNKIPMWE